MNKLKSMFIGMYPMFAMAAAGYSIYIQASAGFSLAWTGVFLTTGPVMILIMSLVLFKNQARTTKHFPIITAASFTGLGLSLFDSIQVQNPQGYAIVISISGFVSFLIYNFWYSSLSRPTNNKIAKGNQLPKFVITATDSTRVSSETFIGNPTVMIFFRGNWCPLCMAQIKEIVADYKRISSLGAKVKFISPQPKKNTIKLANSHKLELEFYTDNGNKAAKQLGIEMKNGLPMGMEMLGYDSDTVLPTVIITDSNGTILYANETNNYRIRPEPEEFIKVLQAQPTLS
ncbi:MAG: peroxiredoxin family protein [Kangiellaceae bacterium]|nr:peroxiredoxin family protein [Kangiellaceae bacterium]